MSVSTIKLLENFVDYCATRNKVISDNIANIGTTNYHRKDVEFKDVLAGNNDTVLKTTEEKHFVTGNPDNGSEPEYTVVKNGDNGNESGVNDVDIDKEMATLARNSLNFSFATKRLNEYFKDIQGVIKSGGTA